LDLVQKLAHLAENLLDRARDGEITIKGGYADLALKSCDTLKAMIEGLEGVTPGSPLVIPEIYDDLLSQLSDPEGSGIGDEATPDEMRLGDILVARGKAKRRKVEQVAKKQGDQPIGEALVKEKAASASDVAKALRTQKKIGKTAAAADATIRVGTNRLDGLINMVGELVIAHSMVTQDPHVTEDVSSRLSKNVSRAGKIVRELQDLSMSLRMVPLRGTFQKMARLLRDLARKAGKSVQFLTEGEDTEIDRNMVEVLNDPLVHMMRNAVDHGVESGEQRRAAGKDPSGTVRLRAYHAAGNVVIELQDDGKGLDREKIIAKALDRGLVEQDHHLTDNEAFGLIFQAGFSTAEKVTDVSGRGVGMDVVRKGIDSLRGRIELASKPGEGTTVTIRVPLTMAIADAMLVSVGGERFLLPTISIEQSFRPEPESVSTVVKRGEMVMVRGNLLPVFRLHRLFSVADAITDPSQALMIIIEAEDKRCALMVDELLGQQQVVIKALGQSMGQLAGVAGGAILGDGNVGLILDAASLLQLVMQNTEDRGSMVVAA
jgi:two-component system chemotaxis sensor kinase CheA